MQQSIQFTVNGEPRTVTTEPDRMLLDVLREDLDLTGAKYGCGERQCGACTVLLNDRLIYSCSTRVITARNRNIVTIEGLADGDDLHPVQEAFVETCALQCGYCTPGMVLCAVALLKDKPQPTKEEIVKHMSRNICRCGTHPRIVQAVQRAAENGGES